MKRKEVGGARWGTVDHGLDSYEDIVNFNEIVFARAFYWCKEGNDGWKVKIFLKNRTEQEIQLTQKGYEWFLKSLKADDGRPARKDLE